jgi:hypothetical protein
MEFGVQIAKFVLYCIDRHIPVNRYKKQHDKEGKQEKYTYIPYKNGVKPVHNGNESV